MKYGERLNDDGTVNQDVIAVHVWNKGRDQQFQTDTYVLKGTGEETWQSRFCYHGFQYVEVTGPRASSPPTTSRSTSFTRPSPQWGTSSAPIHC